MGVDMSMVVRNDFRQRHDITATVKKLSETAEMLCHALKTNDLLLDFHYDDNYFRIYDDRDDDEFLSEFFDIQLFNGFWLIDTAWRYHQYFNYCDERFWLREMLYKYVILLGQNEAYPCSEYSVWNNKNWEDEKMTFEKWQQSCIKDLGHDIQTLDIEDVKLYKDTFYDKDSVYLDTFSDLPKPIL
ncbi:MAG: hypothetical protein J5629_08375 [Muribaculaceae bacterium]|nr:hypothetical protein [Muribaculaceae bacterium]